MKVGRCAAGLRKWVAIGKLQKERTFRKERTMAITTHNSESNAGATRLLMALELGRRQWTIGFMTTPGGPMRERRLRATDWPRLPEEIAAAKARFGLAPEAAVESCYEAGPDGFWV